MRNYVSEKIKFKALVISLYGHGITCFSQKLHKEILWNFGYGFNTLRSFDFSIKVRLNFQATTWLCTFNKYSSSGLLCKSKRKLGIGKTNWETMWSSAAAYQFAVIKGSCTNLHWKLLWSFNKLCKLIFLVFPIQKVFLLSSF